MINNTTAWDVEIYLQITGHRCWLRSWFLIWTTSKWAPSMRNASIEFDAYSRCCCAQSVFIDATSVDVDNMIVRWWWPNRCRSIGRHRCQPIRHGRLWCWYGHRRLGSLANKVYRCCSCSVTSHSKRDTCFWTSPFSPYSAIYSVCPFDDDDNWLLVMHMQLFNTIRETGNLIPCVVVRRRSSMMTNDRRYSRCRPVWFRWRVRMNIVDCDGG